MSDRNELSRPEPADRRLRRFISQLTYAAAAVGFFAISASASGGDLQTGYPGASTVPLHAAPPAHGSPKAQPIALPPAKPDRGWVVDRLYDELMHWAPPGCSSTSTVASMAGGC